MGTDPQDLLPLKPAVFEILLALAQEGSSHGYAILQRVAERSRGLVRLETGPLYRHLKRLLDGGLVEESDDRPDPEEDDPRRRYYRLTPLGRSVTAAEARRLSSLVRTARQVDLLEQPEGTA